MSTNLKPVTVQKPISTSARETVFDVPYSVLYRVEAKRPDGTTEVFENVRAFARSVTVDKLGHDP